MSEAKHNDKYPSRQTYKPMEGEFTAKNHKCFSFEEHEAHLDSIQQKINNNQGKAVKYNAKQISVGDVFVLNGILAYVTDIIDSEKRASKQNKRAVLIFYNGTKSELLLSSLVAKQYKCHSYKLVFK